MNNQEYKTFGQLSREEQLELFSAWLDDKEIEVLGDNWMRASFPIWDSNYSYRIKPIPLTKPSINWEHVHKDYKWMATDKSGNTFVFKGMPRCGNYSWNSNSDCVYAEQFSSFVPGSCGWKDSLVERPTT